MARLARVRDDCELPARRALIPVPPNVSVTPRKGTRKASSCVRADGKRIYFAPPPAFPHQEAVTFVRAIIVSSIGTIRVAV